MSSKSNNQERQGRRTQLSLSGSSPKYQQLPRSTNGQQTNSSLKIENKADSGKIKSDAAEVKKQPNSADKKHQYQFENVNANEKNENQEIKSGNSEKQQSLINDIKENQNTTTKERNTQISIQGKADNLQQKIIDENVHKDGDLHIRNEKRNIAIEKTSVCSDPAAVSNDVVPTEVLAKQINASSNLTENLTTGDKGFETVTSPTKLMKKLDKDHVKTMGAVDITHLSNINKDDITMGPSVISPIKVTVVEPTSTIAVDTTDTLIFGKIFKNSTNVPNLQLTGQIGGTPDRYNYPRNTNHISGRRSIRPLTEFTPSRFENKSQFTESYRRINTDPDLTNCSMNVTVGSEVHNNSTFSFFGFGRKRDRTVTNSESTLDMHINGDNSPPKRARLDKNVFFSAVASPFAMLRSQLSKVSIKRSSTPMNRNAFNMSGEDVDDVQNVSGVSIDEGLKNQDVDYKIIVEEEEQIMHENTSKNKGQTLKNNEAKLDGASDKEVNSTNGESNANDINTPIGNIEASVIKPKKCNIM